LWATRGATELSILALVNESDDHFSSTSWQKLATCKLDMRAFGFAIDVPLDNKQFFVGNQECYRIGNSLHCIGE
jgi:hypothetical protein